MRDLEDPTSSGGATPSQIMIREATSADADSIIALHGESGHERNAQVSSDLSAVRQTTRPIDLEHFDATYIGSIHNRFWVAVVPRELDEDAETLQRSAPTEHVIGMVGVVATKADVAEMRRLRVTPAFRRQGIAGKLLRAALGHCRAQGFLKVILDARLEQTAAVQLFEREGFQFSRNREMAGVELREFYLDLYGSD